MVALVGPLARELPACHRQSQEKKTQYIIKRKFRFDFSSLPTLYSTPLLDSIGIKHISMFIGIILVFYFSSLIIKQYYVYSYLESREKCKNKESPITPSSGDKH